MVALCRGPGSRPEGRRTDTATDTATGTHTDSHLPGSRPGPPRRSRPPPPLRLRRPPTGHPHHHRPIDFPSAGDRRAYAFFYPPKNDDAQAPAGAKPPLIVKSHGGPTSAAEHVYDPGVQFWTSRGFAVVDVNYGGSTGYGRAYRESLRGRWGLVDVEDCAAAAEALAARGEADPGKLLIRGGSAGGYTTLAALAFKDTFAAGASHYGVADLAALARDTHKFESRYLDRLVGPYPERADLYNERSPLEARDRFSCPVIFFQGDEDRIVPPNQAEAMVEALRANGLRVDYHLFKGEQHGFRRAENIVRALEAELHFYAEVLLGARVF
ncbi:MAG: S9 family peptidase [Holophagales bacterium]|nr:S9 family peptidase [Holophagales bacterium]